MFHYSQQNVVKKPGFRNKASGEKCIYSALKVLRFIKGLKNTLEYSGHLCKFNSMYN